MTELLKVNVSEHVEKKNGLTYLSWAWAWAECLKADPAANWEPVYWGNSLLLSLPDGTAFVGAKVTLKGVERQCLLPVMDHRNKAIQNPNAFDVNKNLMRALVKAIGMHGLGLYIYAGEDLPEGEDKPAPRHSPIDPVGVSPEQMNVIVDTAEAIKERMSSDDTLGAYELATSVQDPEFKQALWKLLDSKTRSAIKKHAESLKETA